MKHQYFPFQSRTSIHVIFAALLCLLLFSASNVTAQNRTGEDGYGLSIGTGYDVPVGNLSYTFKPATTYDFSLYEYRNGFTGSISFGYHVYKPKQDTFYYAVDATNYGTTVYQNFTMYSFYLGGAYNLKLTDDLWAYAGINFGVYFTHFMYTSADEYEVPTDNLNLQDFYFAPKIGFNYLIGDHFAVGVEGKYNSFMPTGQSDEDPLVGTVYSSYAVTFIATYNF